MTYLYELSLEELKDLKKKLTPKTESYETVCMFIEDLEGEDLH